LIAQVALYEGRELFVESIQPERAIAIFGGGADVEPVAYLAQHAGLRIREIPVRWNHAEGSKVQFFKDSLRMLREVIVLRARK